MAKPKDLISVIELRRLLIALKEKRPDICIRYRLIGELWHQNFQRVILVGEVGVILNDEVLNKMHTLRNLSSVMQVELDKKFQEYQPYFHYNVSPF